MQTQRGNKVGTRFPVGGSKDAVYNFLRDHGFVMSKWSDKEWHRADGLTLNVYGTGSKARIQNKDGTVLADDALAIAVAVASMDHK